MPKLGGIWNSSVPWHFGVHKISVLRDFFNIFARGEDFRSFRRHHVPFFGGKFNDVRK